MRTLAQGMLALLLVLAAAARAEAMRLDETPEDVLSGGGRVTIGLIGDSTVATQSGWGPAFADHVGERAQVLNYAKNGATLESLSGRLDALLKLRPDYVLIQFGHNDQKRYGPDGYTERLQSYVDRIRAAGGRPVILSSVVRRSFGADGKIVCGIARNERFTFHDALCAYATAAGELARAEQLPFLDLHTISKAHHNAIGRDESETYNYKPGDRTHFNRKGGEAIAALVLTELGRIVPELGRVESDE